MSDKLEKTINGQILDAETGEWVEITNEKQSQAAYVHQQVLLGVFVSAMAIKKVFDGKLYLYLGCQSQEEYIDTMLPYGRSQVYKLLTIARKFDKAINAELTANQYPALTSGEADGAADGLKNTQGLGLEKLYEIARLDDDDVKEFVNKGTLKIADSEWTVDDIKEMTVKEFQKQMADIKKKYQGKVNQLTEENRLLKEENKTLMKDKEETAEIVENAEALERRFGAAASIRKHKRELLIKADELLNELIETAVRINISDEDNKTDQKDLVSFIKKYNEAGERIMGTYEAVTANFND